MSKWFKPAQKVEDNEEVKPKEAPARPANTIPQSSNTGFSHPGNIQPEKMYSTPPRMVNTSPKIPLETSFERSYEDDMFYDEPTPPPQAIIKTEKKATKQPEKPVEVVVKDKMYDQHRKEVLSQMNKMKSNVFEVCPKCPTGRLMLYCPALKQLVCNSGCAFEENVEVSGHQANSNMKAMQITTERAEKRAKSCLSNLESSLESLEELKSLYDVATHAYNQIIENTLNHIIKRAKELLIQRENLVDQFYPDLAKLCQENNTAIYKYNSLIKDLSTLQSLASDILAPLKSIALPSDNPSVSTILRFNQYTFDLGVETSCKIDFQLEAIEAVQHEERLHEKPLEFNAHPKVHINELMANLLPHLLSGLSHPDIVNFQVLAR